MRNKDKNKTSVSIKPAKGRPWLQWVDKQPLRRVTAFPAQHIESFTPPAPGVELQDNSIWREWPASYPKSGLLFHGDNKDVLAHLLVNGFRGKVNLIYIDPPFDSGADYVRKVSLRGKTGTAKLVGEGYTLGEQIQYTDIWANDNYLQFMFERLLLLKELLAETGSIYLHCDAAKGHLLRCLMDEVFGDDSLVNEVIWYYSNKITDSTKHIFQRAHDSILGFSKSASYKWNSPFENRPAPVRNKKVIKVNGERVNARDEDGNIIYVETDVKAMLDVWNIPIVGSRAGERMNYPTQKPDEILRRLIDTTTNRGDVVLDCFIGCGTAAAVAQRLGRRWIGCDINKGAVQTTAKRLQGIMLEQIGTATKKGKQQKLVQDAEPGPAQLSFAEYRVNDYDLQVQHNEAVQLACEHIGVTRSKADRYFDGTMGKRLVKIVAFNHPLTLLDVEEVKSELKSRPDEERDIVLVCLGKETAVDAEIENWNRLRKRGDVPNKLEVIELRTDPKYGKFFEHKPASARVDIKRKKDVIAIEIKDFISPTIVERLSQQEGVVAPKVDDWRQMVDSVMIDPAYDGKVFNIALSDVPEKKDDFVQGKYELPAPKGKTTVAVKMTDMLGEEVLVTAEV